MAEIREVLPRTSKTGGEKNQPIYVEQAGLISPDIITRRPITDHLLEAKKLERARLGLIDKNGVKKPATLGDAERSLHNWWEDFSEQVLSTATPSDLNQVDRIEGLLTESKDPGDLLKALVLVLPRKLMQVQDAERRLDLSERIANRIAEIAPSARSHYAQHKAMRAKESATGIHSVRTNQEGIREAIRQGRETLGYNRKPRPLKPGVA